MKLTNKMIINGLSGLLAAALLLSGCAQNEAVVEDEDQITRVEVVRGESSGIIAELDVVGASMFEFDSAELNQDGKDTIDAFRKSLGPELTDAYRVLIVGHTDNSGDVRYNMWLSRERAKSVAEYLVESGADKDKIRTMGMGPYDPIASNDSREGRIQNRRVDVYVVAEVRALDLLEFPSVAMFARKSSALTDEGKALIDKNIETAREMFKRATYIEVVGHTDNKGDAEENMKLSLARANAVRDYLISKDVPSYKMLATGMGATMPIATNDTEEGRAKNRRVQVLILGRTKE
ncbi:MAG: OmpA family protein [Gammaproteobacteria bacterium]|jgi:outer membrane protein OmpA-like peptidoglycan-associated protein